MTNTRITNIAKLLLPSLIFATSSISAEPENIMLDVAENITNNGTIYMGAGNTIKVADGKWIKNKGTFMFERANATEKFTIAGTNSNVEDSSGIRNCDAECKQMDGEPTADSDLLLNVNQPNYYNFQKVPGQMLVKTGEDEPVELTVNDYTKSTGGTIILSDTRNLYEYLKDVSLNLNAESSVIVLRGESDLSVQDNIIELNHTCIGAEATSENSKLTVNANLVNSDAYKDFEKEGSDPTSYTNSYGLKIKGYYSFGADNSKFSKEKVEIAEGESVFTKKEALFPTEIEVSGGKLSISNGSNSDNLINLENTLKVGFHTEGVGAEASQVCGCVKIDANSGFNIAEGGILSLGVDLE